MGDKKEIKTVLILGGTGVGKSALCFHLGDLKAISSSQPVGTTLHFQNSEATINNDQYTLVDTCGFNESKDGSVTAQESVAQFMKFIKAHRDGFHMVMLIKREKNDSNLDKNMKLIQSLMPSVPIHLVIQGVKEEWKEKECKCKMIVGEHTHSAHTPNGIKTIICLDLPGKDRLDEMKEDDEWTPAREKRLEADIKRLKEHITKFVSSIRHPITTKSISDGFKEFLNSVFGKVYGKAIFVTEAVKKVIAALIDLGVPKDEAEKTVYEYAK